MNLFNLLPQEQELLENVIGINCEEGLERDGEKFTLIKQEASPNVDEKYLLECGEEYILI